MRPGSWIRNYEMYKWLCRLYRVYCLSEVCESSLMWSHYARRIRAFVWSSMRALPPFERRHEGQVQDDLSRF